MEKNQIFTASSISHYTVQYTHELNRSLMDLDRNALAAAAARIAETAKHGGTLYVAGNGGSAAISEHLMCDFMKGSGLKVQSLVSNISLLTALANDIEYEEIFAQKLKMLGACQRDCLLLISSSGNSPNVLRAAIVARDRSMPVIGMTGFSGGDLKLACDVSLHINAHNYGVIEDAHQALMHILAQWHTVTRSY